MYHKPHFLGFMEGNKDKWSPMPLKRKIRREPLKIGENPNEWEFEKYEYDLDIVDVYRQLEKQLNDSSHIKPQVNKKEYLENLKHGIEYYCQFRKIDFNFHFTSGNIIIPSTEEYYVNALGTALICWDFYKIRAFLNHQKEKYLGENDFVKMVEFGAYSIMVNNSPFEDIKERQNLIMQWVEEQGKKPFPKTVQDKKRKLEIKKWEDLFTDKSQAESVIQLLKKHGVVNKDGTWEGITNKNSEVLALIDVLREKHYIKKHPQTLTAKLFCEKFALNLSDRSLRTKTQAYYDNLSEYQRILPDLQS